MIERIQQIFEESIDVKRKALEANGETIIKAVDVIAEAFRNDGKLFLCGNGGSAADSQHIAAEFIGRFQKERQALPAIALTTDSSILTCLSNDYEFDVIFARQLEGLARKGDVVIGISTSGESGNVIRAFGKAAELGCITIGLTGKDGGKMGKMVDIHLNVPSSVTARIQESHICIAHTICELVEEKFS